MTGYNKSTIVDTLFCQECNSDISIDYIDYRDRYFTKEIKPMFILEDGDIVCDDCVHNCKTICCNYMISIHNDYCKKCYVELTLKHTVNNITTTLPIELVNMILTFC